MEYLSQKEINNKPTQIYKIDDKYVFMSIKNKLYVTKQIYMMHKKNGGILDYLYFKSMVPVIMYSWISKAYIPKGKSTMDVLDYLNKQFIKENYSLYELKVADKIVPLVDTNVYKTRTTMGVCDEDDNVHIYTKKYGDLLASDYGSIDVWTEQTTEFTPANMRYGNKIPIWQKNMNIRNYDRNNEGYHSTRSRASLNNRIAGYGNDFSNLQQQKLDLYTEQTTRSPDRNIQE